MSLLLTFCASLLLLEASYARPSNRFKELILHERIVPFDDSMAGDDYYGDLDAGRDFPRNDNWATKNTTKSHESISHQDLPPSSGDVHGGPSTAKNLEDEDKAVKRHRYNGRDEVQRRLLGNESKVTEGTKGQRPGDYYSVATTDFNGATVSAAASTSVKGAEDQGQAHGHGQSQGHGSVPEFHDPCRYVYCRVGRVCAPSPSPPTDGRRGKCVCAGPEHCRARNTRRVCGSDGHVYPSHCELHRSACLKGLHISTDHSGRRCSEGHSSNDSAAAALNSPSEGDLGDAFEKISTQHPTPISSSSTMSGLCTRSDLKTMLSKLISMHCAKLGMPLSCTNVHDRHFVVSNIFRSFDHNGDNFLDALELNEVESTDHNSTTTSTRCSTTDLLWSTSASDRPGQISSTEFLSMLGASLASLDRELKVFTTSVTVGNSVELKCDVKGTDRIVWKRKGNALDGTVDKQVRVFDDGSLYIGDLRLDHMGNYTCQDRMSSDVIQTHVLLVQSLPQVKVYPSTQIHVSGSTVILKCHADGIPRPQLLWEKNEWPLQTDNDEEEDLKRFLFIRNNTVLEIKSADYKYDTGAYKCKAKNSAGTSDQVAAVFIENVASSKRSSYLKQSELFAVFHDMGYTVYEVGRCHTEHQVTKDFRGFRESPERQKKKKKTLNDNATLCPSGDDDACSWSDAVLVKNKFLYVTQPQQKRIVVIERDRSNPTEMILLKCSPEKLDYNEQLDEVWVTCLQSESSKSIVIIRQASSDRQHFPLDFPLDSNEITGVFLPEANSLKHSFDYGYIAHGNSMALKKLHLASVAYAKDIDLQEHGCIPASVHLIPIGGLVLVGCRSNASETRPSFHLVLDYMTDGLLERLEVNGYSHLSPDARRIVILGDGGNTAFVFQVSDEGVLRHVFDEYTQLQLDSVAFFPSESGFDYDAFITTADRSTILHLDLESGRVSTMEGAEDLPAAAAAAAALWPARRRLIVSGALFFDEHLVSASDRALVSIDGKRRRVLCQWRDVVGARVLVPLPTEYHGGD